MPSPFPGMDPYLEGSLSMSVHTQLSAEIARQLAPKLRPGYLALTSERFVFETAENAAHVATSAGTGVATAPLFLTTIIPEAVPQVTVEIRDTANRQLVTAIEVLSPTNKRGDGREEYLAKRGRILVSTAHLVEIDLLRTGKRVPIKEPLPSVPYFVFIARAHDRPGTAVYPILLTEPLPLVPVPLLAGDAEVQLDLQQALGNVYDLVGYDLAVDYSRPPEVPLPPDSAAWAEERLLDFRGKSASG